MKKVFLTITSAAIASTSLSAHKLDGISAGTSFIYGHLKGLNQNKIVDGNGRVRVKSNTYGAASGGGVGAITGYDLVLENRFIIGIEAYADKVSISGKHDANGRPSTATDGTFSMNSKYSMTSAFGANLKGGMVFNETAVYLGIGLIAAQFKYDGEYYGPGGTKRTFKIPSSNKYAAKVIGGIMLPVSDKVVAGVEVGYARFGRIRLKDSTNDGTTTTGFGPNTVSKFTYRPVLLDAKLRVIYKV